MDRTKKSTFQQAVSRNAHMQLYNRKQKQVTEPVGHIERRLIQGVIVSDTVAEWADQNIRRYEWIQSTDAEKIIRLVLQFYDKHKRAPKQDMQDLFFEWLRSGKLSKEQGDEWQETLLPDLSDDVKENGLDEKLLIQQAGQYFDKRRIEVHIEAIQDAIQYGNAEQAEHLIQNPPEEIRQADSLIIEDMYSEPTPMPPPVIWPWLCEGDTVVIYGKGEVGKTWLSLFVCHALSCGVQVKSRFEIGGWELFGPVRSLYVVGERARKTKNRIQRFMHLGQPEKKFRTMQLDRAKIEGFNLGSRKTQKEFIRKLKQEPDIKLVVFDNVGTLFDLEEENNNSEWKNKLTPLKRDLEAMGVAHIIIHHTGKDEKRGHRGGEALRDMADVMLYLKKVEKSDEEETLMNISVTKQNDNPKFKDFDLRFYKIDDKKTGFEVVRSGKSTSGGIGRKERAILYGLDERKTFADIAREIGKKPQDLTHPKNKLKDLELITGKGGNWSLTEDGEKYLDGLDEL